MQSYHTESRKVNLTNNVGACCIGGPRSTLILPNSLNISSNQTSHLASNQISNLVSKVSSNLVGTDSFVLSSENSSHSVSEESRVSSLSSDSLLRRNCLDSSRDSHSNISRYFSQSESSTGIGPPSNGPKKFDQNDSKTSVSSPNKSQCGQIPKIIMQTWKTRQVPDKWKSSPQSIAKQMGDWDYILMTDDDNRHFIATHFPDFLPYYDKFEYPIQRADAIRYAWLYIKGGVYLDLDTVVQRRLDPLFENGGDLFFVASGNVGSYLTNSFMASRPRHPVWLEMIEEMKKPLSHWYVGKHLKVMNSTGPMMLNYVVKKSHYVYSMLPAKLTMPCSVCDSVCVADDSYILPLEGSSWTSWDTKFYNFCLCNTRFVIAIILIILLILFLWWFLRRQNRLSQNNIVINDTNEPSRFSNIQVPNLTPGSTTIRSL